MATLDSCLASFRHADGTGATADQQAQFKNLRRELGDAKALEGNLNVLEADEQAIRNQLASQINVDPALAAAVTPTGDNQKGAASHLLDEPVTLTTTVTLEQSDDLTNPINGKGVGLLYNPVPAADVPTSTRTVFKLMKMQKTRPGILIPLFAKPEKGPAQGYTAGTWYLAEYQRPKIGGKELAPRPGVHAVSLPVFDQGKAFVKGSVRRVWVETEMPTINPATQAESDASPVLKNGMVTGITERLIGPSESYNYKTNPSASEDAGGWPIAGSMKALRIVGDGEITQILTENGLEDQIPNSMTQWSDEDAIRITQEMEQVADVVYPTTQTGRLVGAVPHSETLDDLTSFDATFTHALSTQYTNNRDLKVDLQERVLAEAEQLGVDLSDGSPETLAYLVRVATKDALYALKDNANAVGWYDEKVTRALDVMTLIHPELATDEEARLRFIWGLAVTSNGLKVNKNFEWAERVYSESKKTGKFTTNVQAGAAQKAINDGLNLYNDLLDRMGVEDLHKFMISHFEAGMVKQITGVQAQGENADTVVRGAAILGPKIGNGFFSNLYGYFDALTMDRWLMRTWGRWTGSLIEINKPMLAKKKAQVMPMLNELLSDPARVAEIEAIATRRDKELKPKKMKDGTIKPVPAPNPQTMPFTEINEETLDEVAKWLTSKILVKKAKRTDFNQIEGGDETRKVLNSYMGYADGQVEQPRNGDERNLIREVFYHTLTELQTTHGLPDLTMSDLQALVWYPEKLLYDTAKSTEETKESYDDEEAPDYANAAEKLALEKGISKRRLKGLRRSTSGAGSNAQQGAKGSGKRSGFDQRERKRFLARSAVHKLRSNRKRNEASSRPYKRDSGRDGKRVRLLRRDAVAVYKLDPKARNAFKGASLSTEPIYEVGAEFAADFTQAIQASKDASKFGASVYVYSEEEYAGMRLFRTKDGKGGFAIKDGRDIVSVFSGEEHAGLVHGMIELAIQEGGVTLDAFDTVLPELYGMHGFKITGRLKWSDEYAPPGWSKGTFKQFNKGSPDVVYMALDVDYTGKPEADDGVYYTDPDVADSKNVDQINAPGVDPTLFQDEAGPKGAFRLERDIYGNVAHVIEMTDGADRSTFLHETGHFWLYQLNTVLNDPALPERGRVTAQKQWDTMTTWFTQNSKDAWRDIQKISKAAQTGTDPERAALLKAAVDYAKKNGGEKYMKQVAAGFMNGSVEHGTALEIGFHELWARGVETYLYEGKSPSAALKHAFSKFTVWLTGVYKNISNLNVTLSPEIRDVFDRIIATEQEIEEQRQALEFQIPSDVRAQVTDDEERALRRLAADAEQQASEEMHNKVAKDIQRENTAEFNARKAKVRERVTAEVREEPLYKARNLILKGIFPDGTEIKDGSGKASNLKLSREEFVALYGVDAARAMPKGSFLKKGTKNFPTIHEVAQQAGFEHPDAMIDALTSPHLTEAQAITTRVDLETEEDAESLLSPDNLADAAAEAVANTKQLELMATQSRILRRLARDTLSKSTQRTAEQEGAPADARVDRELVEDAQMAAGAEDAADAIPGELRIVQAEEQQKANRPQRRAQRAATKKLAELRRGMDLATIKEAAFRYVQAAKVGQLSPGKFRITAERLGKKIEKAIAARKYDEAAALMDQRTLNIAIAREADKANRFQARRVKRIKELLGRSDKKLKGAHDLDIINTLRIALEPFGLADFKGGNLDPHDALAYVEAENKDYYDSLIGLANNMAATAIPYREMSAENAYKEMPYEEFVTLMHSTDTLLSNSRDATSMLIDGERTEISDIAADVRSRTDQLRPVEESGTGRGSTKERDRLTLIGSMRSMLLRIESWGKMIDGEDFNGPISTYLVRPVINAVTEYNVRREEPMRRLLELLVPVQGELAKDVHIEGPNGWVFRTKGEIIAAMLHTGNSSNLYRLLIGGQVDIKSKEKIAFGKEILDEEGKPTGELDASQWNEFIQVMATEGILTKEDMDLVQGIWDIHEDTKGAVQRAHKAMFGYHFTEIEAEPLLTPWGEYAGGYAPAVFDELMDPDAIVHLDADALATQANASIFPGAQDGFTKARQGQVARPLKLDITQVPAHFDKVMKFAYLGPAIHRAARLVKNKTFASAINAFDMDVIPRAIIPWLQRTVAQQVTEPTKYPKVDKFIRNLNSAVGLQAMTGNVVNALQQISGIPTAMVLVKPKYFAQAQSRLKQEGEGLTEAIIRRSPFMGIRLQDGVRELARNIEDILTDNTVLSKTQHFAEKYGYLAQQTTQNMIDPIVWVAAEIQAREEGLYQNVYDSYIHLGHDIANTKAEAATAMYADSIVRDTQSPMGAQDVSRMEAGNAFIRLFTKFSGYFNNMFNLNYRQYVQITSEIGWKGKPGRLFYLYLFGLLIPSVMAEGISMAVRGAFDDDDDEYKGIFEPMFKDNDDAELMQQMFDLFVMSQIKFVAAMVPGGGAAVTRIYGEVTPQMYDDKLSISPGISFIDSAIKGVTVLAEAIMADDDLDTKQRARALKEGLNAFAIAFRIPLNWFAKPVSYLIKVEGGESDPENVWDYVQGFLTGRDGTEE